MGKEIDVVVIGHIIKETIEFQDRRIGPVIGSPVAYSSLVMAAQGKNIGIVSYYGNDMDDIISELDVLDRRGLKSYDYTTTNLLVYKADGTKYVDYQRKAPKLYFEDIYPEYLDCQFFKICPMDYEVSLSLVERLAELKKTVFVDLGGYGGATSDIRYSIDESKGKEVMTALCNYATIIKASSEDLASIFPGKTAEQAAQMMVDMGAQDVVVTMGGDGSFYKCKNLSPVYFEIFQAHSNIADGSLDFTGAGDSFGAGFMASYSEFQDIPRAIVNGNATASLVIENTGGCTYGRMPSKARVMERINTGK
ncbi:MAG: carbohydrate kinase family protein [Christensenella sp.]|nr:carbohydrate kinase family protein [Christensenella sp.]